MQIELGHTNADWLCIYGFCAPIDGIQLSIFQRMITKVKDQLVLSVNEIDEHKD
jgi:hypothetical protein